MRVVRHAWELQRLKVKSGIVVQYDPHRQKKCRFPQYLNVHKHVRIA